jgi:hypothetical protein
MAAGHLYRTVQPSAQTLWPFRLVQEWLASARWTDGELVKRAKSDPQKIQWAQQMREKTPMARQWIAEHLAMGNASYVSHLTRATNCRL